MGHAADAGLRAARTARDRGPREARRSNRSPRRAALGRRLDARGRGMEHASARAAAQAGYRTLRTGAGGVRRRRDCRRPRRAEARRDTLAAARQTCGRTTERPHAAAAVAPGFADCRGRPKADAADIAADRDRRPPGAGRGRPAQAEQSYDEMKQASTASVGKLRAAPRAGPTVPGVRRAAHPTPRTNTRVRRGTEVLKRQLKECAPDGRGAHPAARRAAGDGVAGPGPRRTRFEAGTRGGCARTSRRLNTPGSLCRGGGDLGRAGRHAAPVVRGTTRLEAHEVLRPLDARTRITTMRRVARDADTTGARPGARRSCETPSAPGLDANDARCGGSRRRGRAPRTPAERRPVRGLLARTGRRRRQPDWRARWRG